ncbi:hypothetical protein [Ectopseudomonas guguanensis]|uniref:hypothetical protein n=1 Tax=Ectopseudomonas guguanensis TaxID=1198456 RepID=UPI002858DD65|nr:hypothetical protein [Pseudomonas guguanensis]MDR8014417.1 hypothetical protein [Pseudomonas guguanensis]
MINYHLKNKIENFLENTYQESELLEVLESLSATHDSLTKRLLTILNTSSQGDTPTILRTIEKTKSSISTEVHNAIRKTRFSTITRASEKIKTLTDSLLIDATYEISTKTESFLECLDDYLHAPNNDSCFSLTASANELLRTLNEIQSLGFSLGREKNNTHDNPSVTIYIPGETDLESFSLKLSAIASILESCCQLLGLSTSEGEVEIEKIESGSFFAEISANPLVVALATIIITKGTDYIFNQINPTRKGEALKDSSENLEKILGIRDFLAKNNLKTEEIDEQIKKSAVLLAKKLNHLIEDQQEIEINNKIIKSNYQPRLTETKNSAIEDKSKES